MWEDIVLTVSSFAKANNVPFREAWLIIYQEYETKTGINVTIDYKMGPHRTKFEFLYAYEELYGALTKFWELIKELK